MPHEKRRSINPRNVPLECKSDFATEYYQFTFLIAYFGKLKIMARNDNRVVTVIYDTGATATMCR